MTLPLAMPGNNDVMFSMMIQLLRHLGCLNININILFSMIQKHRFR